MIEHLRQTLSSDAVTEASRTTVSHLLAEFRDAIVARSSAQERMDRLQAAITAILNVLPTEMAKEYSEQLRRAQQELKSPTTRGGDTFGKIVDIIRSGGRREWKIRDIQQELGDSVGDTKSIYNAINYLATSGRLRRMSRGVYMAIEQGVGIEFDGPDDGTIRFSEHND